MRVLRGPDAGHRFGGSALRGVHLHRGAPDGRRWQGHRGQEQAGAGHQGARLLRRRGVEDRADGAPAPARPGPGRRSPSRWVVPCDPDHGLPRRVERAARRGEQARRDVEPDDHSRGRSGSRPLRPQGHGRLASPSGTQGARAPGHDERPPQRGGLETPPAGAAARGAPRRDHRDRSRPDRGVDEAGRGWIRLAPRGRPPVRIHLRRPAVGCPAGRSLGRHQGRPRRAGVDDVE